MQTKKITVLGLCVALVMILSYIESILPVFVGIPGAKLGLPNMVIVLLLYLMGAKEAVCVNILRILLSGFLFGCAPWNSHVVLSAVSAAHGYDNRAL